MYMSSQTYYNWFNKESNLDNLPVMGNSNNWYQFESINVPILTFLDKEKQLKEIIKHINIMVGYLRRC